MYCAYMPAGQALQATKLCPKNPGPKLGGGRSDDAKEPESQTMKLIFLIGVFLSSPLSYRYHKTAIANLFSILCSCDSFWTFWLLLPCELDPLHNSPYSFLGRFHPDFISTSLRHSQNIQWCHCSLKMEPNDIRKYPFHL